MRRSGSAEDDCSISPGRLRRRNVQGRFIISSPSDASVDVTNGTSLRRNPLLTSGLQLLPGGRSKRYVDMCNYVLGYRISEFRLVETVFIYVILACGHPEIRRKAMRYKWFRLKLVPFVDVTDAQCNRLLTGATTPFLHSAPLLARCAAAFARLPQTAMLHQRRVWAFVRSRNTSVQAEPSHDRISRKS